MNFLSFLPESEFEFCSAGKFIAKNNPVYQRRILDSAVLLIGIEGKYPISQGNNVYNLEKNTFMLHFPGYEHYGYAPASDIQSHFWCHFYLPDGCVAGDDEAFGQRLVLPEFGRLKDMRTCHILFNQLIDSANRQYQNDDVRNAVCSAYIKIILVNMASDYKNEAVLNSMDAEHYKRRVLATKVKEWIRVHKSEKITAHDVADAFHYNMDYLTQVIRAETGKTVSETINRMRIEEAKKLLLNTDMKIAEISYEVGFSDEKYFMKTFKKYESITASEFRQSYFRIHINTN